MNGEKRPRVGGMSGTVNRVRLRGRRQASFHRDVVILQW